MFHITASGRTQFVLNFQAARLMHRHDKEWVEMSPVAAAHSPDALDPERRLMQGATVYRCDGCDDEIQVAVPKDAG